MLQWRDKAVDPPGDCRSELRVLLRARQPDPREARGTRPTRWTGRCSTWPGTTPSTSTGEPDGQAVLREINGTGPDGKALSAYTELKADGSTALRLLDLLRRLRRRGQPGPAPQAALGAGPGRRRSGAGCGRPTGGSSTTAPRRRPTARRGASASATSGGTPSRAGGPARDVPDFIADRRAGPRARAEGAKGPDAIGGTGPVHHADRRQGLAVRAARAWRTGRCRRTTSRRSRRCATRSTASRTTRRGASSSDPSNPINPSYSDVFPYVFTTYRLTEHHTAGAMSRTLPYLTELQPEPFCEVSPRLARRARARARRLGDDRHRAHRDRGAGAGHRPDALAAAR